MTGRTYLDWNATAPLRPEAREAMTAAFDVPGNPSSVHAEGRKARGLIETARQELASLLGARTSGVVFTSGGTEANVQALTPGWRTGDGRVEHVIVSAIEHPSVLSGGRFRPDRIAVVPVTPQGLVDLPALDTILVSGPPALVSVMAANNETGAIQPIAETAEIVHQHGGLLHVDGVQGFGRIPIDCGGLGIDLLTISGHKIGGPKGVGALVIVREGLTGGPPLLTGGGQELNRRAGTENLAAIMGLMAAAKAAMADLDGENTRQAALRDQLEEGLLQTPGVTIFAKEAPRLPNTTLFTAPGLTAETAVIAFDLEGIALSSGAACSSGKVTPSHVLGAMGVPGEMARGALRVSLGRETTANDVETFLKAWRKLSTVLLRAPAGAAS